MKIRTFPEFYRQYLTVRSSKKDLVQFLANVLLTPREKSIFESIFFGPQLDDWSRSVLLVISQTSINAIKWKIVSMFRNHIELYDNPYLIEFLQKFPGSSAVKVALSLVLAKNRKKDIATYLSVSTSILSMWLSNVRSLLEQSGTEQDLKLKNQFQKTSVFVRKL